MRNATRNVVNTRIITNTHKSHIIIIKPTGEFLVLLSISKKKPNGGKKR